MNQSRLEILRSFVKEANPNMQDFSYSAIMRQMRKQHPERVKEFMRNFKNAFDAARSEEMDSMEQIALMQAIKSVGL